MVGWNPRWRTGERMGAASPAGERESGGGGGRLCAFAVVLLVTEIDSTISRMGTRRGAWLW